MTCFARRGCARSKRQAAPSTGTGERAQPAVILLDIRLPDMDGGDVARQLKADARTRRIPVIAMTSLAPDEGSFLEAGFDGYLGKPIDVRDVPGRCSPSFGEVAARRPGCWPPSAPDPPVTRSSTSGDEREETRGETHDCRGARARCDRCGAGAADGRRHSRGFDERRGHPTGSRPVSDSTRSK